MQTLTNIERELNPFSTYRKMRQEQPAFFDPQRHNWNIFRYADVQRVLSEYGTFSSKFMGSQSVNTDMPFAASMISTDPPRHRKLRSLVNQAFTPRAVESLAPRISEIVEEYLDRATADECMDVIDDLGYPLPVIVIAELLGIPSEDRERFKAWSDIVVQMADLRGNFDPERFTSPAIMEMSAYFFSKIEERRKEPGDDLISGLLAAEVDGEKLEIIDLLGFCALLLVAGNETTTNLLGNSMYTFANQPEAWESLRDQPELLESAIEEVLRYRSPVQSMFRVTKQETNVAGVTIPAGSPVVAWIGSANHDEDQFPEAERFDIARSPNRHLAFGDGIHYCLGAPLARLEARIALGAMLERFRSVELEPDAQVERMHSMLIYGLQHVPIRFEKA